MCPQWFHRPEAEPDEWLEVEYCSQELLSQAELVPKVNLVPQAGLEGLALVQESELVQEVVLEQLEVVLKSELDPEAGVAKPWRVAATAPVSHPNPSEPAGTGKTQTPWPKFKLSG